MAAPLCFELPEWNQTIVIDRKAEETPHLTSTHAESNYTPSASALAPAWGFQRARGERMGVGIKAVEWWGGGHFGWREREACSPPKKKLNATLLNFYWSFKSRSEFCVVVTCVPVVSTGNTGDSAGFSCVVLENNSTRLLSGTKINNYRLCLLGHKGPSFTHTHKNSRPLALRVDCRESTVLAKSTLKSIRCRNKE